jgi:hypothetical protein
MQSLRILNARSGGHEFGTWRSTTRSAEAHAQVTPLTFPPRPHVEGVVALRVLSLFQGLYRSNHCAVGRQFLLHLGRQPREARKAKETVARDEAVDICLVNAVALHEDWVEDVCRIRSPDLVDALAKDFGVDVVYSRDNALARGDNTIELLGRCSRIRCIAERRIGSLNHLRRGRQRSNTFAPAFAEQSANRLGRVEVELIVTLTKVVIVLNLHEQRFEASLREACELVCVVLPQGATRGFHFVKNEANNIWKL